jgi:hypothetical protein
MMGTMHPAEDDPGGVHQETIALLQEEIARLESELLAREDACQSLADASQPDNDGIGPGFLPLEQEISRLRTELAARDDTINLLFEQLQLVEEAEAAGKAEWEQLARWVAEVEERVEQQGQSGSESDGQLSRLRREADDAKAQLEREQREWHQQKSGLEEELQQLQFRLSMTASVVDPSARGNDASAAALEAENNRLRQRLQEIERRRANEVESLEQSLDQLRGELEAIRHERDRTLDERERERREFEVALASLRAQATRASLAAREAAGEDGETATNQPALEADMRIRAFRQHLKEIHCHEAEVRQQNRLSARLTRLWGRTTPGPSTATFS